MIQLVDHSNPSIFFVQDFGPVVDIQNRSRQFRMNAGAICIKIYFSSFAITFSR